MNLTFSGEDGREFGQSSPIFGVPPRKADESPRMGARRCDPIESLLSESPSFLDNCPFRATQTVATSVLMGV
jgi:hypothetical protein